MAGNLLPLHFCPADSGVDWMRTLAEERERLKRLAAEYKRRKKGTEAIDAQIRDITNRLLRKELRQMKRKAA